MDFRMMIGPLYAAGCVALVVGVVTYARAEARERWQGRPVAWLAVGAVALAFLASRSGFAPAQLISSDSFTKVIGLLSLVCGAVALLLAFKARSRASACYQAHPLSVDEAVAAVRGGGKAEGVFEGRVTCEEPVTSPGGIVCVAYEAELREARLDGGRGSLVNQERAYSHVLQLAGDKLSANVALNPAALLAKTEVRRCLVARNASAAMPSEVLASGELPNEALSWERVLRMGSRCRIVGKLERANERTYRIKGVAGMPPLILVDEEVAQAGQRFFRSALAHLGAAAILVGAGVWLLHGI